MKQSWVASYAMCQKKCLNKMQDVGRAVVIGSSSYGKGTVQTVMHLPNDGELTLNKLTGR